MFGHFRYHFPAFFAPLRPVHHIHTFMLLSALASPLFHFIIHLSFAFRSPHQQTLQSGEAILSNFKLLFELYYFVKTIKFKWGIQSLRTVNVDSFSLPSSPSPFSSSSQSSTSLKIDSTPSRMTKKEERHTKTKEKVRINRPRRRRGGRNPNCRKTVRCSSTKVSSRASQLRFLMMIQSP